MKKTKLLLLLIWLTFSIIGCTNRSAFSTPPSTHTNPTSTELPTEKPPMVTPGRLSTPEIPSNQAWPTEAVGAVDAAVNVLANQTKSDVANIKVVSVNEVNWSDGCLGIQVAGVSCIDVITPGYKIILVIDSKQYEVHSDSTGKIAVVVASQPLLHEPSIVWLGTGQPCQTAVISNQGVSYGSCQEVPVNAPFTNSIRVGQLADLIQKYQTFSVDTQAGKVTLTGQGQVAATPAEQRSIAEWAGLVFMEEQRGMTNTDWNLAFTWQQVGGIAGFCDDLSVYRDGEVIVSSCKGEQLKNDGHLLLNSDQLDQLYRWVDGLKPFEVNHTDQVVADGMTIKMKFFGTGQIEAQETDQFNLLSFASELSIQARK